jgi:hypothetical protein
VPNDPVNTPSYTCLDLDFDGDLDAVDEITVTWSDSRVMRIPGAAQGVSYLPNHTLRATLIRCRNQ